MEFAIPGVPTDTIDLKVLADSVHLTAPARDIEYVAALALAWPVKPGKAEAIYEHGLLRIEVPFKDPMEDAVKVAIKASGAEATVNKIKASRPVNLRESLLVLPRMIPIHQAGHFRCRCHLNTTGS